MPRRAHVPHLSPGSLVLPDSESHHLRNVLRLEVNDPIELFDDAGHTALATITQISPTRITVQITTVTPPTLTTNLTIASALPKGDRADWMIEKLSELGVTRFIPLQTARSVVHPEGKNKFDRWNRIATEAAKQSHRPGILQINPLTPLATLLDSLHHPTTPPPHHSLYLSPASDAPSLSSILYPPATPVPNLTLFIGPEGGWSPEELTLFTTHNIPPARLTDTILRIETAAITAAALAACAGCASIRQSSI
jgi:16S rRNA (uracil1498-N3)-methyltransferase